MKDLFLAIVNIFRWTGKIFSVIRNGILNSLLVIAFIFLISALVTSITQEKSEIEKGTGLLLSIAGDIVEERKLIDPMEEFFNEALNVENPNTEILLQDIVDAISHAGTDPRISFIQLDVQRLGNAGLPQLATIGQALKKFRDTGKKVVAVEDFFTQNQYYLACFADEIIINPMGGIDIHGFSFYRLYFKDALDKLKINYHVFRVGTHKSALEPFMRNNMSPEDREQSQIWLSSLWSDFSGDIAKSRNVPMDKIIDYTDNSPANLRKVKGDTAQMALDMGLVDKILTRIQVKEYLATLSPGNHSKSPQIINLADYLSEVVSSYTDPANSQNKIGLVIAQGMILPGEQPTGRIGGDSLAATLRKAAEDHSIKGIVLRIDSGGGSAFASEIIRQELLELKRKKKVIVVSMGNVAASGGYWIAADADEIWASPTTITGSIGIFGAIPTFENSLAELGVYGDGIGTTKLSSGINITMPLSSDLSESIQLSVENGYDRFLDIVANGRNLSLDEVKSLANGKVYDGKTAHNLGLVDQLGGLDQAIESAAQLAGLNEYSTVYIKRPLNFRERLLEQISDSTMMSRVKSLLPTPLKKLQEQLLPAHEVLHLKDPKNIFAHSMLFSTVFN